MTWQVLLGGLAGLVACLCVPQSVEWYTPIGKKNVYPYVLNVLVAGEFGYFSYFATGADPAVGGPLPALTRDPTLAGHLPVGECGPLRSQLGWLVWLACMPVATACLLASWPVRLVAWPLVEPHWLLLFEQGGKAAQPAGAQLEDAPVAALQVDARPAFARFVPSDLGLTTWRRFGAWVCLEAVVLPTCLVAGHVYPAWWRYTQLGLAVIVVLVLFGEWWLKKGVGQGEGEEQLL